jgi:hypothetical protein
MSSIYYTRGRKKKLKKETKFVQKTHQQENKTSSYTVLEITSSKVGRTQAQPKP